MSKKSDHEQFFWKHWKSGKLPELEDHSETKLDLLRDYLVLYLEIVMKGTAGKDEQYVTLVDGFAGGGIYNGNKFGSPITILKAVEEAEARINLGREKTTRIIPICYFIEKDTNAFECLDATLKAHGYGDRIGKTIHLHRERFEKVAPTIIANINTRHKRHGNRTIFFLDQCGWSEISAATIRDISQQLHQRPEFIVNFAISWLTDFISDKTQESKIKSLQDLGLEGFVDLPAMMNLRFELGGRWEHAVEAHIGEGFHKATGISYFSPFYIEPEGNHRGYWLLHLAGSARARSAMTQIHWSKANRSKHYGHLGYDMLSYKPNLDQTQFIEGMSFDDESRKRCETALAEDFQRLIKDRHKDGIPFKDFLDKTTNKIMATAPMVQDVVWQICQTKEFEVRCPSGKTKKSMNLADDDIIMPRQQFFLEGLNIFSSGKPQKGTRATGN
jgi:three-Cys-motif partner protein